MTACVCVILLTAVFSLRMVTTFLKNLEMSGNLTAVTENAKCQGKLFNANYNFGALEHIRLLGTFLQL